MAFVDGFDVQDMVIKPIKSCKVEIGQRVFIISDSRIIEVLVVGISISQKDNPYFFTNDYFANINPTLDLLEINEGSCLWKNKKLVRRASNEVFPTKEDLINSLKD